MDSANSSNSSIGGVILEPPNGKQISPSLRWCLTLNNYTSEEVEEFSSIVRQYCRYGIVGYEQGEEGTPHLQGYIEFKTKKRPMSIFGNKRIHWEKAKGNRKVNYEYCFKEKKLCLLWPHVVPIKTIDMDQLKDWQLNILDEIKEEPDDRTIHWLWSSEGGVGKTTFLKYLVVHEDFVVLGGKAADCRNGIIEYAKAHDGATPKRIGINIPRSFCSDYVSYEGFENIKDMLFYSGKYEGGMICGNCPHVYIFANFEPDKDNLSKDRWKIREIKG